jgi:hypothetical protein
VYKVLCLTIATTEVDKLSIWRKKENDFGNFDIETQL